MGQNVCKRSGKHTVFALKSTLREGLRRDNIPMPIACSLGFKLLDLGKRIIFARDWIVSVMGRLTGWNLFRTPQIPEIGFEIRFPSGARTVTGWLVAEDGPLVASALLFSGIGDKSENWRLVQQLLAQSGVRSLIFHYPGYGGNEAEPTQANMEADARAAYAWFVRQVPAGTPVFLVGFSLGSGLSAAVASSLRPVPSGLILSEAFSTLREAAKRAARSLSVLGYLMPDVWRTRENVVGLEMPLFVIHSSGDRLFPVAMAEEIYSAAKDSGVDAAIQVFADYPHDAVYWRVPEDYWAAIVEFMTHVRQDYGELESTHGTHRNQ
jgi:uncharacterized protein